MREVLPRDNPDELHAALDVLNQATLPLAERLMNAVVRATLRDQKIEEVDVDHLAPTRGDTP